MKILVARFHQLLWPAAVLLTLAMLPLGAQNPPHKDTRKPILLHYTIKQMEGDKVLNARTYVIQTAEMDHAEVNVRTSTPILRPSAKDPRNFEYMPTGLTIAGDPKPSGDDIALMTRIDLSNLVVLPGKTNEPETPPVIRSFRFQATAVIQPGRAVKLGMIDDLATHQHYEFDVMAEIPAR